MTAPRVEPGEYELVVKCPRCDTAVVVRLSIASRLVEVRGELGKLGARVKVGKVDHDCEQLTLLAPAS